MNIYQRSISLIAVTFAAATGLAFAARIRRQQQRAVCDLQHGSHLKAWENEGGNLAPASASAVPPAVPS